ncbi:MAG: ABC transporter permease, partial [Dehalococcoidia bacterium]|nr:ABC transporter permease [Dehalococcoidia bacterium]
IPASAVQRAPLLDTAAAFDREMEVVEYVDAAAAGAALDAGDLDAVLIAPDQLRFEEDVDDELEAIVRQSLVLSTLEERAAAVGLSLEEAQSLLAPVEVQTETAVPAEPEDDDAEVGQGVGALSALALMFALTFYGQWVVVGVIEEKSNRVVEVLLAAVTPSELLVGKVLGIMALALAQVAAAAVAFVVVLLATEGSEALPSVAVTGLGLAVVWLVIGLLLYNFLYAAVGATVNRPEEATSVTFPLMVPLMGGYFVGLIFIPDNPDSSVARIVSMFPLTAPLTMPSRIASGGGSAVEVVVAMVLALVTLVGVIWLAGRVYSGGILQSSKVGLLSAFRRARDIR